MDWVGGAGIGESVSRSQTVNDPRRTKYYVGYYRQASESNNKKTWAPAELLVPLKKGWGDGF